MNNNGYTIFLCVVTFTITLFVVFLLTRPAPLVNSMDKPFIIEKIGKCNNNKGMVKYYGVVSAGNLDKPCRPCIVAPSRMYNIGDTIYLTTGANIRKFNQVK